MNEQKTAPPKAPDTEPEAGPLDDLEALPADELRAVMERAGAVLARREKAERDAAMQEIREIADAHGLKVSFESPKKKRGRPAKT
jgi:hypothetical protein